jgi:peptide deformylase
MLRKIKIWPSQSLKKESKRVEDFEGVKDLIVDLVDTCRVQMGAGLAAPQIGVNEQVVVIKPSVFGIPNPDPCSYNKDYMVIINPELLNTGDETEWKEGCLSIPGADGRVKRATTTLLKYQDEDGEEKRLVTEWPFSGGIQHECDHLIGKLFIHRMPKRRAAMVLDTWRRKKRKAEIKAKRAKRATR